MIYLKDEVVDHPKLLKAGARLGEGGVSQAFHLYVMGIAYSRQHLTDGFVPEGFVSACGLISKSSLVANALSARGIRLWRKVRGGYLIHNYHKHNPKAATVKENREKDRQRKIAERSGRNGNLSSLDIWQTRGRASHVPRTTKKKRTSTDAPRRLALARSRNPKTETPSFALACVVMREARQQSWQIDHDGTLANVGEHFKQLCAQRGLAYDADLVRRAFEAVVVAAINRKRA